MYTLFRSIILIINVIPFILFYNLYCNVHLTCFAKSKLIRLIKYLNSLITFDFGFVENSVRNFVSLRFP